MRNEVQPLKVMAGGLLVGVLTRHGWAERMVEVCRAKRGREVPEVVISANGNVLAKCYWNPEFREIMEQADIINPDGQSLVYATRWLTSTPIPERVATTDFFHDAAKAAEEAGLKFYFLGATRENIEIAVRNIQKAYPKLKIVGYRDGYFPRSAEKDIIRKIMSLKPDVLWVGLGVPRQEEFVIRNRSNLKGIGWIKTCGGLFDYFNPTLKRAPAWMQRCGLEWLFRTFQEPRKYFWRYLTTNGVALWLLLTRTHTLPVKLR